MDGQNFYFRSKLMKEPVDGEKITIFDCELGDPNYDALEKFIGADRVEDFAYVNRFEIKGNTVIYRYKHKNTRRYLCLDMDGNTWRYNGIYLKMEKISRDEAIMEA